jgi:hypothetical protein
MTFPQQQVNNQLFNEWSNSSGGDFIHSQFKITEYASVYLSSDTKSLTNQSIFKYIYQAIWRRQISDNEKN